jgi:hypothetical protein
MKRIDTRYYPKIESRAHSRRALRKAWDREGAILAREAREGLHLREAREAVAPGE